MLELKSMKILENSSRAVPWSKNKKYINIYRRTTIHNKVNSSLQSTHFNLLGATIFVKKTLLFPVHGCANPPRKAHVGPNAWPCCADPSNGHSSGDPKFPHHITSVTAVAWHGTSLQRATEVKRMKELYCVFLLAGVQKLNAKENLEALIKDCWLWK